MRVRLRNECADRVDDLLQAEQSRIEDDDAGRSRVKLSHGGIVIIAPDHLVGYRGSINPLAQLGMATSNPSSGIRHEQHADLCVRGHDGSDVTTFSHDAPRGGGNELTLPAHQLTAD